MLDHRFNTFLVVTKHLSYTHAARELFITQPAVSQHIKYIEDKYDIKIFNYQGRNLSLTKEGEILLRYVQELNVIDTQFIEKIVGLKREIKQIRFGATLTIGEFSMEGFLKEIYDTFNDYQIAIHIDNTRTLLKMLKSGDIKFALIEGLINKSEYNVRSLKLEDFVMVVSPDNSISNKSNVDLNDILSNNIIVREKGSGSRDILEKGLDERNLTFNDFSSIIEIGNINLIKTMTKNNLGITFLYKDAVIADVNNGDLAIVEVNGFKLIREFNFVTMKNSLIVDETEVFYHFIKDKLSS